MAALDRSAAEFVGSSFYVNVLRSMLVIARFPLSRVMARAALASPPPGLPALLESRETLRLSKRKSKSETLFVSIG